MTRHMTSLRIAVSVCLFALIAAAQVNPDLYAGMKWRSIGSFRAGRASAVCGVTGQPGTYYAGAALGGLWKSEDAGATWVNITDATLPQIANISAIAVAPSDPNIVYFGTGAGRGTGVYKSTDAGATWHSAGLADSKTVATLLVDPRDPNLVLAAASGAGHGVYRSTDGGSNWTRTLTKDAQSGAGTLQWAFDNPKVVFATMVAGGGRGFGGGGGGRGAAAAPPTLYKSTDEGLTWTPITTAGIPALGPFTVAMQTNSQRLYSIGRGGLYRSDDGGQNWTTGTTKVYTAGGNIYTDPKNPDLVYSLGTAVYRSTDGGHSITPWKGSPGGDDPREWWIDPTNGNNILYGGDQGMSVSINGGKTWSPWYNQPTAQIYHLTVDDRFPYWVYGAQQDSGIVATKSRGDFGQINPWDWIPFPGWEGATLAVDPLDANVIYTNGNYGDLGRVWLNTWDSQIISPSVGHADYHRNANSPILFSPQDPHTMYFVTQYVMMTKDGGNTVQQISPDLTLRPGAAPVNARGARGAPSIIAFTVSAAKAGVLWAGAPGVLSMTQDGGQHWANVTPADWAAGSGIVNVEASHFDPNTAYVVVDRSAAGDEKPYIYRTRDAGKTFQLIVSGMPADQPTGSFVRVVREDPKTKGLLFAGTETEVHVSFDDGDHWQSLRLNAPNTSYRDLVVHGNDLVTATYGRSFWVLDDISPLRLLAAQSSAVAGQPAYLFKPSDAIRLQRNNNYDTPLPPEVPHALNPPEGAVIYYYLGSAASGEVKIQVLDSQNRVVRVLSSTPDPLPDDPLGAAPDPWKRPPQGLPTAAGMHRVNWDLHWTTPVALSFNYDQVMGAIYHDTPPTPQGPKAAPGNYTIKLMVDGKTYSQPLVLHEDPRVGETPAVLAGVQRQQALALKLAAGIAASRAAFDQLGAWRAQLKQIATATLAPDAAQAATALDANLAKVQGAASAAVSGAYGVALGGDPAFSVVNGQMAGLLVMVDYNSDMPPVAAQYKAYSDYCSDFNRALAEWKRIGAQDVPALNSLLTKAGASSLSAPTLPAQMDCAAGN